VNDRSLPALAVTGLTNGAAIVDAKSKKPAKIFAGLGIDTLTPDHADSQSPLAILFLVGATLSAMLNALLDLKKQVYGEISPLSPDVGQFDNALRNNEDNILCQPTYLLDLAFCVVELLL